MNEARRLGVRRLCVILTAVSLVWVLAVMMTGGFTVQIGGRRLLSSRETRNPLIFAAASFIGAVLIATHSERRRALPAAWQFVTRHVVDRFGSVPSRVAPLAACVLAAGTIFVGIDRGALVAGGSDSFGYVSQADLWVRGDLHLDEPLLKQVDWPYALDVLAPLGYIPNPARTAIVPTYPPGYPMQMALAQIVGGRNAAFYVVPVCGGLAVLATYFLGAAIGGRLVGLTAASLLATSSLFYYQLINAMSDVPVTAWWALALLLAMRPNPLAAWLSGSAAAVAVLTRPNLAPVTAVIWLFLLAGAIGGRNARRTYARRLLAFTLGVVPAIVVLAAFQAHLYGSPLRSGYGPISDYFSWSHVLPNLQRYPRWLIDSNTPIVVVGALAPLGVGWLHRRGVLRAGARPHAFLLAAFIGGIGLSYIAYQVFDAWWYARFLLPLLPPLFVLAAALLAAALGGVSSGMRRLAMAAVVIAVGWHNFDYVSDKYLFGLGQAERKYAEVGSYVRTHLPGNAVIFAMQHSGSVRYYSGRPIVRWDLLPLHGLDAVLNDFARLGYHPYLVAEAWEVPMIQRTYSGHPTFGAINWPPMARHLSQVMIYDVLDTAPDPARAPDLIE